MFEIVKIPRPDLPPKTKTPRRESNPTSDIGGILPDKQHFFSKQDLRMIPIFFLIFGISLAIMGFGFHLINTSGW